MTRAERWDPPGSGAIEIHHMSDTLRKIADGRIFDSCSDLGGMFVAMSAGQLAR